MTAVARIDVDYMRDGIKILLGHRVEGRGVTIVTVNENGIDAIYPNPMDGTVPEGPAASLRLPDDLARALLDALLDHYRLSQADLRLRADYDAERKRVDKLTDALLAQLARSAPPVLGQVTT